MLRRFHLHSESIAICTCAFIIIFGYIYFNGTELCPKPGTSILNSPKPGPQTYEDTLLEIARMRIKIEMWNYNFSHSGVDKLEDMVMELGGTPVRSIVVSTWRSGSSFLGSLINSLPGSFYWFEPLMMFGVTQIREPPLADRANNFLKNILKCDYYNKTDFVKYFTFARKHSKQLKQINRNERFWEVCKHQKKMCFDAAFTEKVCKIFPIQTMKLDRLRLRAVSSIIQDEELNAKVVLLVRDPRGVMQSRRNIKKFCTDNNMLVPDCADTSIVCSDMVKDYKAAADFAHKYPNRLMVLRFEDLALNIQVISQKLLHFLRMEPTESFREFSKTHTTASSRDPYSTSRITRSIPFKWRKTMKFIEVRQIQEECKEAMALWGYVLAHNVSHMASKKFNPLVPYYIKQKNRGYSNSYNVTYKLHVNSTKY